MNISLIRNATRGVEGKLFFNSAGASLMPDMVVDRMLSYIKEEEQVGGYALMNNRLDEINTFYTIAAKILNCEARNMAFTTSATDSYSRALLSIPFNEEDVILTTEDDYISSYIAFNFLKEKFKIKVLRCKNLENGDLDLYNMEELIKSQNPKVVSVTHIPTNSGLIQDVCAVGDLCEKYNVYYIVDACQSIGQMEVDVRKIKCDFLSATGRKFVRGPRGTGLLYVSDKALEHGLLPMHMDMRGAFWQNENEFRYAEDATRFEQWEFNYSSLLGLKEALQYIDDLTINDIYTANKKIASEIRAMIAAHDKLFLTDKGSQLSSIITFSSDKISRQTIEDVLKANQVYYSLTLKEYAQIDYAKRGLEWSIRFSPHYFNTSEEVNQLKDILSLL